jgi:hypothetical protein
MQRFFAISTAMSTLLACTPQSEGSDDGGSDDPATDGDDEEAVDERVEIPPAGPDVLSFVSGEFIIPAGEDRMMCTSIHYEGGDVAYRNATMLQGKGGHHAVLLGTREPLPAGTVVDCSDAADMSKYELIMLPQELPPGHGAKLPAGQPMVMQSHYVNTTSKPIRVRDVVQLELVPMDEVRIWTAPMMNTSIDFEVPAGQTHELSFDCVLEHDVELLTLVGHMHEWGTRFRTEIGPTTDALELLYLVDPWKAEYRDMPPTTLFFEQPKPLAAGTIIRTTCSWDNTDSHALVFPHEMCITLGIVSGRQDPIECRIGE